MNSGTHEVIGPGLGEPEQALEPAVLEHQNHHAEARGHGEQVQDDRLDRDHDRAERDQQQQERRREHEREHVGDVRLQRVREVAHPPRCCRRRTPRRRRPIRSSGPPRRSGAPRAPGSTPRRSRCRRSRPRACRPSCRGSRRARPSLDGSRSRVLARRPCSSFASPALTAGAVTSSALMTTSSDEVSDGNASCTRLNVCTTGSSCGSEAEVFGVPMSIPMRRDRHRHEQAGGQARPTAAGAAAPGPRSATRCPRGPPGCGDGPGREPGPSRCDRRASTARREAP